MSKILVTKRSGRREPLNEDKAMLPLIWSCENLSGVSASQIAMKSKIQFYDGITTKEIHEVYVKTAADLISEDSPNYQYVAGRLAVFGLRKEAYGQFEPPSVKAQVERVTALGFYDEGLLASYDDDEWSALDRMVQHSSDLDYAYAAVKQLEGKYLVKHRVTKQILESPQMACILIAATIFIREDKSVRLSLIEKFYNANRKLKISLPTPIMAGVRSRTRQYSSCVLIESGDSLDEINTVASSIVKYVSQRAGIGIGFGQIRGLGSAIRGGEAFHTGCIPFLKHFQTAVKCCSQGGVRGGAATAFYPMWHTEFRSLIVLKNNRGIEENRVRHLDYGVQLNRLMYQRLLDGGDISLFSPADVAGLYDAFFEDQDEFERLYLAAESDESIKRDTISALEAFSLVMQERASTGRVYIQNVDHTNVFGSFIERIAPVRQSNLCLEITLPTKPLKSMEDPDGEIALCTLAAFNLGAIDDLSELEELSEVIVRALDNILSYQDYPILAAEKSTKRRRSLGVGVINYAYYLAKNGVKYSDGSSHNLTHRTFEAIQYYLIKASMNLAKERGKCDGFEETKYSKGVMPIDNYKADVDKLHSQELLLDWETLRADVVEHGLRNSTLTALMPSETSSQISNATNGIEPPRGYRSVKQSKDGILSQIVPEIEKLKGAYELLWDMPNNTGYIEGVGIMQKFVDQAISANTNYDPTKFLNDKVPMKVLLTDLLKSYQVGVKTLYYHNTRDGAKDDQGAIEEPCEGGGCVI